MFFFSWDLQSTSLVFWACSKVKSGRHFIEGILGSFLVTLFYPGPHFIEATAWVVSTWTTRCPSCTIWLNKMSNTFKIFQDHSSKTAKRCFFFFVCVVFSVWIFGIQNQSSGNRTTNIAFAQGSQTSNSTSQSSWQQVARLATSTTSFFLIQSII